MNKKLTRLLCVVLALVMAFSLAACGKSKKDTTLANDPEAARYNPETYDDESAKVYEQVLGEFASIYEEAKQYKEQDELSKRYALMAVAEGKMLGSAIMIPLQSRGGNYAISRVAPRTINSTLWGSDNERYHSAIIVKGDFLPLDQVNEMRAKWGELIGTGTYEQWVKDYLASKGYELNDEYNMGYSSDANTWDVLATSMEADSEKIIQTYDGLYEYDMENVQQPALATSVEVSADGLKYTFKIREGVIWTDSQGRKVADLKADDWVAGMQHMLDAAGGLEYLVGPDGCNIAGAAAYMAGETTDFSTVGVKAIDDYTLEYTLAAPCPFFMTMLGYSVFAPMSREYYVSQGGKFGEEYDDEASDYTYGKTPDNIAYNGPFVVTNATAENTIVFKAAENYWNAENTNIKSMTWYYNDGTDALKNYNDAKAEKIAGSALTGSSLEQAKKDGLFEGHAYVSATNATSFMGFFNVNRYAFSNFNDNTAAVSTKTVAQAERTLAAMQNVHFRRALLMSLDRGAYNAQGVGEELKYNSLINSYTPGNFVFLTEDTTIDINGTATTFPAGTFYGEIVQAQLDADGITAKVWDPTMEGGIGASSGFDGWYNPEAAQAELKIAIEELGKAGVKINEKNPIYVDLPVFTGSEVYSNRGEAFKQSVESATGNLIIVNKVDCPTSDDWYYAGYYYGTGYEANFDICDLSGWGPDYGDPQTYLDTMQADYAGYMVKALGIY
ncbi:MAG: peptide ABC transporter substrate-binding protein [Lachnospiraceae bacterium]|nr:peptide ABC transporter substrate-binding protein [Lachnospiraceae bacterium]